MHINIKGGGGCMRKKLGFGECSVTSCVPGRILTLWLPPLRKGKSDSEQKSNFGGWRRRRRRRTLAERPRESLVMRVPVTANPTKKGQLRFHSRLKNTGHGSNSLIFSFPFTLSFPPHLHLFQYAPLFPHPQTQWALLGPTYFLLRSNGPYPTSC